MRWLLVFVLMWVSLFGNDVELFEELRGKVTDCGQYIVLATKIDGEPFEWYTIPMQKTTNKVERFWGQTKVLWQVQSGRAFDKTCDPSAGSAIVGHDAFCDAAVIAKQQLIESAHMRVLYNYAPISELHFLIIPKRHVVRFDELTAEEFTESMEMVRSILEIKDSPIVYLFEKTGKDAGQTVPHAHMHLVMLESGANDFWSKLVMLKNMTFGSSPLPPNVLEKNVQKYRNLFTSKNP